MNTYYVIDVLYLRSSRTIETILLHDGIEKSVVYVYNRDGLYYYFFNSVLELIQYFDGEFECEIIFDDEEEIKQFLRGKDLG